MRTNRAIYISILLVATCVVLFAMQLRCDRPRVKAVGEVPVSFWAWRQQAPTTDEVSHAFSRTHAKTLFLRTGQFDSLNDQQSRIRPVAGSLPSGVELHLVYNATPELLRDFEKIQPATFATVIAQTYTADREQAATDTATVVGLQLDLDIPTRLLPNYAQLLRELRPMLPPDTKLSITGLPTWITSDEIGGVLSAVDFWIPQLYGGDLPTHLSQRIPISSVAGVEHGIERIRRLGVPFHAGLSAYGYAILYDPNGNLLELRGDIDPTEAARTRELELIDRQKFKTDGPSNVRYEFRVRSDAVLNGLVLRPGQTLVLDLPTSEVLRASARVVRENGGEHLLGICVFRLPISADKTVLTAGEIASALEDAETRIETSLVADSSDEIALTAENIGDSRSLLGDGSLTIEIDVPPGSLTDHWVMGFALETICRTGPSSAGVACSDKRANVIRLSTTSWTPGSKAGVGLEFTGEIPPRLATRIVTQLDSGRVIREQKYFQIGKGEEDEEQ